MTYQDDIELAKEKMLQAERALENYFLAQVYDGTVYDPEKEKQLRNAAATARDKYVNQLGNSIPE